MTDTTAALTAFAMPWRAAAKIRELRTDIGILVRVIGEVTRELEDLRAETGALERYDRQKHIQWHEEQFPDAENWPPLPRTDEEAAKYIAAYSAG